MRVRTLVIAAVMLMGGLILAVGARLSGALSQMDAVRSGLSEVPDDPAVAAVIVSVGSLDTADARGTSSPNPAPAARIPAARIQEARIEEVSEELRFQEPEVEDESPLLDEREFLREYFGDEVSLNDLGQLASPDPEFEQAMQGLANEFGEIPEID